MFCGCGKKKKRKKTGKDLTDEEYEKRRPTPSPPKEVKLGTGLGKNGNGTKGGIPTYGGAQNGQDNTKRPPSLYHNDELGKSSVHNIDRSVESSALINAAVKIAAEERFARTSTPDPYLYDNARLDSNTTRKTPDPFLYDNPRLDDKTITPGSSVHDIHKDLELSRLTGDSFLHDNSTITTRKLTPELRVHVQSLEYRRLTHEQEEFVNGTPSNQRRVTPDPFSQDLVEHEYDYISESSGRLSSEGLLDTQVVQFIYDPYIIVH